MNGIIHISWAGPERYISAGSRIYKFEDHHYCGPIVLGKTGDPLQVQPPESSPFWRAVNCWYATGKRTKNVGDRVWCEYQTDLMRKRRTSARQGEKDD